MDNEEDSAGQADTTSSLEKIKKQLHSYGAGNVLLQGPLLKRSDIIRKWEWRWFALDVSTGKLEYWSRRGDTSPKGLVKFDAYSTATVSPKNMMKEPRYDACCFYIITSQKKEYFFCAETAEAAEAWVATLRAAISVLRAHKEASSLLSGNARIKLENVATVVAAANVIAQKAAEDLQRSMKAAALSPSASFEKSIPAAAFSPSASFKKLIPGAALSPSASFKKSITAVDMNSSDMMRETLKVKDEELHQLASDIKSRDLIIKELADRLTETADAAESAASSVQAIDKDCREALSEVDHLRKQLLQAAKQIRDADARRAAALKFEETALQEAHRCRLELGKLRERGVILEAAMVRVEEDTRRLKVVHESEIAEILKLRLSRMESTSQGEISSTDEILQEDNVSKPADVSSKANESMLGVHATLPDAQAPELELTGSCEAAASGLRMESDLLPGKTSAECAGDLKDSLSCIEEIVPEGAPCTDGASPSLSETDEHERGVSLCSTLSNLPETALIDDGKAVPSQPCTSANCASTTIADDCKDVTSKAIVTACDNQDPDSISDGNNEIEIAVVDEVNMITMEDNELATGLELPEGIVAQHGQYKREGISLSSPSLMCIRYF
ncbi:hypothetical protein KC19_7G067600 [Ceratodon purpureus]|uniref:PH domain-containing protein n=1 Tax=Ceratodon purpureus TaxID=3225 RepID=A0A8T0H3K7_CERPU|nr:hypothetical protein KC19_7G067600 [Ceratodon purpureus]KAG0566486.1 hypothetical protein KC19_7G067600 [Ceratodon purpureus]